MKTGMMHSLGGLAVRLDKDLPDNTIAVNQKMLDQFKKLPSYEEVRKGEGKGTGKTNLWQDVEMPYVDIKPIGFEDEDKENEEEIKL